MYRKSVGWAWGSWRPSIRSGTSRAVSGTWGTEELIAVASRRDQVDDGEDHDPHDVDEVPVEPDQLDDLGPVARHPAPQRDEHDRHQHDDPDGHVHAVEPGQGVEARAEQAGRVPEALAVEGGELVHLAADEGGAQQGGGHQPESGPAHVV